MADSAIVPAFKAAHKMAKGAPLSVPFDAAMRAAIVTSAGRNNPAAMMSYSIIPLAADGTIAKSLDAIARVSMPHCGARGSADFGEAYQRAFKAAGFKAAGFAQDGTTPEIRAKSAAERAVLLVAAQPSLYAQPKGKRPAAQDAPIVTPSAPIAPTVDALNASAPTSTD